MTKTTLESVIGYEGTIIELSNKLQKLGCEDICNFGNWSEILDQQNVIIAIDECGDNHIKLDFEIVYNAGEEEIIEATEIKVINVEDF